MRFFGQKDRATPAPAELTALRDQVEALSAEVQLLISINRTLARVVAHVDERLLRQLPQQAAQIDRAVCERLAELQPAERGFMRSMLDNGEGYDS